MTENDKKAFDVYADNYDVALARGISVSGEDKDYFAQRRIEWLRDCLQRLAVPVSQLMDFGCGTGSSSRLFLETLGAEYLIGTDRSPKSLEVARRTYSSKRVQFFLFDAYQPCGQFDLVFCNGVFHHIAPEERGAALKTIRGALREGGTLAFFENNPWNPGARMVMARIPFDRDAQMLSPTGAKALLELSGFEILRTDSLFFFPRMLQALRFLEPLLGSTLLGAQYLVLAGASRYCRQ